MKYLLPLLLLLTGCATHSMRMDEAQVQALSDMAAALSHRHTERAPPVYLIDNWAAFKRISCGQYMVGCGLGTAGAFYTPAGRMIFVNISALDESLEAVLIHELTHHLQITQGDKRPCFDKEQEAYQVQQFYSKTYIAVLSRAGASCAL